MSYAKDTEVPASRSREEINTLLRKAGAKSFGIVEHEDSAIIAFTLLDRHVKFHLPFPSMESPVIKYTDGKRVRSASARKEAYEREYRRLWRAVLLIIKAKLELVQTGILTFEDEFLAHFVTATGKTIGETLRPQLESSLKSGAIKLLE